jgi:hypothetical protein
MKTLKKTDRAGGMLLALVIAIAVLILATGLLCARLKSSAIREVAYGATAPELEQLALSALDEAGHRLLMSDAPGSSERAARAALDAVLVAGLATAADARPAVPPVAAATTLAHDTAAWLRSGENTLHIATVGVAGALDPKGEARLEPVRARVVRRRAGRAVDAPARGGKRGRRTHLPLGVAGVRTTWGVLELSASAHSGAVARGLRRYCLFEVVEVREAGGGTRTEAHIFENYLGQVTL